MTANEMRDRAKDCFERADKAREAAKTSIGSRREWLLSLSEHWASLGRQFETAAASTV